MDVLIPIVFPDYKIAALGTTWGGLGHAGILFILAKNGTTKYYEYGRYKRFEPLGGVERRLIPDVKVVKGALDHDSLSAVMKSIASKAGHNTRISGAYVEQSNGYLKAFAYADAREKLNADPARKPYTLLTNNCGTFMKLTLDSAGVSTPSMIDPSPTSYIKELRGKFRSLDYDPKTDKLTIAKS